MANLKEQPLPDQRIVVREKILEKLRIRNQRKITLGEMADLLTELYFGLADDVRQENIRLGAEIKRIKGDLSRERAQKRFL